MAAPLATCTKEEQRSEGVEPIEIRRRMKVHYGDSCQPVQQVYQWTKEFMNGISYVTVSPRPGQTRRVVTPEGIAAVEAIVKENRHVTVNEIAAHLAMSHGSAHCIVHDVMQFHKYLIFNKLINMYSFHLTHPLINLPYWSFLKLIPEDLILLLYEILIVRVVDLLRRIAVPLSSG
jgi:hypothetical protein